MKGRHRYRSFVVPVLLGVLAVLAVLAPEIEAGLAGRERKALRAIETSPAAGFEPRLVLNDNADSWDAESFRDRLTIVNFWATWCPPCLEEMPLLAKTHREWDGKGLRVLGVTSIFEEDEEPALAGIRETLETVGVGYPVLISDEQAEWDAYLAKSLPVTVLVDRAGRPIEYAMGMKGLRRLLLRAEEILGEATGEQAGVQERAQQVLAPLKQGLARELSRALAIGPGEAIEACAIRAPAITAELTAADVRLGRTSHRVRNPRNAPEPWMEPLLAGFLSNPGDRVPHTVRIDDDTMGYVEPIQVQKMCLTCHGDALAPELKRKIDELYPGDEATGFAAGDFRGMFWVTLSDD